MSRSHDPYAAFRIHDYRLYVIGWLVARMGTYIQSIAIAWEIYQRTGEALSLGLVGLAQALPLMVLALPAGLLADRYERRRLSIVSLLGMTATSLALAAFSIREGPVLWMYALLFLDACMMTVGRPARTALLPQLVPADVFPNAVTWNTSLMHIASVAGPALGGFVVAVSVPSAYIIAAASSLWFVVILSRVRFRPQDELLEPGNLETLLGGIRFVWDKRILFTLMALDLFAVLLGGAVYLLPIYAKEILHVGATGFGYLHAAPAVGAFCMAVAMVYLPPMKRAGRTLLLAVAGFGAATIIFGFSQNFALSWAMLFLTGAFDNISMVVRQTLTQLLTPDRMRGRVSAVSGIFIGASNELGGFESGLVAQWFGPVISVVSGGIGTILVVAGTAALSPRLLRLGAMHEARAEEEG
ncbi:MAG: MFS transporter [Caldilineaceae bacterium]|nr:MFS transporter [Caldilineaceae bacterium]MCY4091593.1 MFS transporter [Caldilineaceae bacterium]